MQIELTCKDSGGLAMHHKVFCWHVTPGKGEILLRAVILLRYLRWFAFFFLSRLFIPQPSGSSPAKKSMNFPIAISLQVYKINCHIPFVSLLVVCTVWINQAIEAPTRRVLSSDINRKSNSNFLLWILDSVPFPCTVTIFMSSSGGLAERNVVRWVKKSRLGPKGPFCAFACLQLHSLLWLAAFSV